MEMKAIPPRLLLSGSRFLTSIVAESTVLTIRPSQAAPQPSDAAWNLPSAHPTIWVSASLYMLIDLSRDQPLPTEGR
jgi:hypothetical protein